LIEITLKIYRTLYTDKNIKYVYTTKNYVSPLARAKKERLCLSVRDNVFLLLIVRKS
jgi:hypothetical protein